MLYDSTHAIVHIIFYQDPCVVTVLYTTVHARCLNGCTRRPRQVRGALSPDEATRGRLLPGLGRCVLCSTAWIGPLCSLFSQSNAIYIKRVWPGRFAIKHLLLKYICKVSVLFTALLVYAKCPYYLLLYMQSVRIINCFICKVSVLFSALYAKCPYYLLLRMQSALGCHPQPTAWLEHVAGGRRRAAPARPAARAEQARSEPRVPPHARKLHILSACLKFQHCFVDASNSINLGSACAEGSALLTRHRLCCSLNTVHI